MAKSKRQRELDEYNKRLNREKASGKSQKPVTVLTKDKKASQSWAEDRPQALASKIGSPRKADAQIIYENDKFNKRKKTKDGGNFDWDGNMLKKLPNKQYGRSYADKFNSLANEAGIPMAERGAFKDYLDAKEYKANTTAGYDQAVSRNDERVASTMKKNEREQKEVTKNKKAQEVKNKVDSKRSDNQKGKSAFGKSMDFLASLTAFDDVGYQREQEEKEKAGVERSELDRLATRTVNSANFGIPAQLQKRATGELPDYQSKREFGEGGGSDVISDMLGYVAPGVGLAKAGRLLGVGADLSKNALSGAGMLTRAKEGAQIGFAMSGAETAGREALNPDDYNWKQNLGQIALETGAGALLDPVVDMIGPLAKAGADRSMRGAVDSTNADVLSRMMEGVGDIPTMPSPLDDLRPQQNQLERLMGEAQRTQVQAPRITEGDPLARGNENLAKYTEDFEASRQLAEQTKQANRANASANQGMTDYEPNFQMVDSNPLRLEAPKPENYPRAYSPDAPVEEKLAYWRDPNTPRTEEDVQEIFKTMQDLEAKASTEFDLNDMEVMRTVSDIAKKDPELQKVESDFTDAKLKLSNVSSTLDEWNHTKEIQALYKEKPEWMKFAMPEPERLSGDYDVPKRFLVSNKNKGGLDIFSASEQAGFGGDIDAFVDHLQNIDFHVGRKKKDIVPAQMNAKWVKEQTQRYTQGEEVLKARLRQEMGIDDNLQAQIEELSTLMTPYTPPVQAPANPLEFRTQMPLETPRNPITEITYPNNQYAIDRPMQEASATTVTPNDGPESLAIEQLSPEVAPEPKMVRVKNQEDVQTQAVEIAVNNPKELKTLISKGSKESDMYADRIIDTATKNPVLKVFRNYRQKMVSSKVGATYAERDLLKREIPRVKERLASASSEWEKNSIQYELDELTRRMKATKDTSYTQMALENETGADIKASNLGIEFVTKLNKIEGTTIAEATEWQLARRLDWLRKGDADLGVEPRNIPATWSKWVDDRLASPKPAFEQSEQIFREMQERRLQELMRGGNKSQEEIDRLMREPFYVPAYMDESYKVAKGSNVDKGLKGKPSFQRTTSTDITTIKSLERDGMAGDPMKYIKNPVESIIDDVFKEQRSIARNDTAHQFRRLSQMDDNATYVKEVDQKTFEREGGEMNTDYITGYENGEPFYLKIHPEFRQMLKENDTIDPQGAVQIATSVMSRLKTTSPEYLVTAIPRDIATSFLNTENPVKFAQGLWKSLTDEAYRKTGLDAGVQFRNAYDPQSASQQGVEQLNKQIKEMAGFTDVDATNWEKASSLVSKAWEKSTNFIGYVGQKTDDLPRIIEANIVKERWEKKVLSKTRAEIDDLTKRLETAPKGDFEQGNTSQLQSQLESLQERLAMETRGMEREMTHRGRDVINYQRSGSSGIAKAFKKYVNFANTTTQSKDKIARTFYRDPVGTTIKGATLSAPLGFYAKYMYDNLSEEEQAEYDAIEDYIKQQRYVIPLGGGEYVTVPKVQELAILTNQADAMNGLMSWEGALEYAGSELTPFQLGGVTGGLIKASNDEGGATYGNASQNMAIPSTVLSPLADMALNTKTTFNGKPVSYNREGGSDDWTMDMFKDLTGGSDWANPLQYGALQYGGDWAKYALRGGEYLYDGQDPDGREAVQNINPLQDMIYRRDNPLFKEMLLNKEKLEK